MRNQRLIGARVGEKVRGGRRFPLDGPPGTVTVVLYGTEPSRSRPQRPPRGYTMLLLRALPLLIVAGAGGAGLYFGPLTDQTWRILLGVALGFATLSSLCML